MNKPIPSSMRVSAAAIIALTLGACSRPSDDQRSAGEKIDEGIAKVESEAKVIKTDALRAAADAKQVAAEALQVAKSKAGEVGIQAGAELKDAGIVTSVKAKLADDSMFSLSGISVESKLGHVDLRGSASDELAVARAGQIAQAVTGVTGVTNHLTVKPRF
jgi:hyperosmotically inducible protein